MSREHGRDIPSQPGYLAAVTLPSSIAFSSSDATGDYITCDTAHGLTTGDLIEVAIDGGTTGGVTANTFYYAVEVTGQTARVKLATTYDNAIAGTVVNITADIGAGDVYPVAKVYRATLYVGTAGNVYVIPGSLDKNSVSGDADIGLLNVANGTVLPYVVHAVATRQTTASNIVAAY